MLLRPAGKNSTFQAETKSPAILARELAAPGRYGAHLSQPKCWTPQKNKDGTGRRYPGSTSPCRAIWMHPATVAKKAATRENAENLEKMAAKFQNLERKKRKNYKNRKKRSDRAQEPEAARNWASGSKKKACCAHGIADPPHRKRRTR